MGTTWWRYMKWPRHFLESLRLAKHIRLWRQTPRTNSQQVDFAPQEQSSYLEVGMKIQKWGNSWKLPLVESRVYSRSPCNGSSEVAAIWEYVSFLQVKLLSTVRAHHVFGSCTERLRQTWTGKKAQINWESKPQQPARKSRTKLEINYRLEKLSKPTKQKNQNAENVKEKKHRNNFFLVIVYLL